MHSPSSAHPPPPRAAPPRSWCPHCRAFKPTYEKVAAYCARSTPIKVFRADCAQEVRRAAGRPKSSPHAAIQLLSARPCSTPAAGGRRPRQLGTRSSKRPQRILPPRHAPACVARRCACAAATRSPRPPCRPPTHPPRTLPAAHTPSQVQLCQRFKVRGYPTLLAGNASAFAANDTALLKDFDSYSKLGRRSAANVVAWLGTVFSRRARAVGC